MAGPLTYRRAGESFEILRDGAVVATVTDEATARLFAHAEWAASILQTLGDCQLDGFDAHQPAAIIAMTMAWLHAVWPDEWPEPERP